MTTDQEKRIAERAKHPAVRQRLRDVREWAKDQVKNPGGNSPQEHHFYARALTLGPAYVLEAADLTEEIGIFMARELLDRRRSYMGLFWLYGDLVKFLLTHGVTVDAVYGQPDPVAA